MAGRRTGTPKTGGRRAGTPNKRTVALRTATATAAKQISAALGSEVFYGDAHALLMTVYKDLSQPIGLRMEAAKAALPYEKPRLASIENKVVDEFDTMSEEQLEAWLDERAEQRVRMKMRRLDAATSGQNGRSRRASARSVSSTTASAMAELLD
jgi:type II secretory pathway component PulM